MANKDLLDRVAGAPISWGLCEAPDWEVELGLERVLDKRFGLDVVSGTAR